MLEMIETPAIDTGAEPTPDQSPEAEARLTAEITALCAAHKRSNATARRTRKEITSARHSLGEKLYELKNILACTGRSGRWTEYLRTAKLARASADRYVREHATMIGKLEENCLSEALSEPAPDATARFIEQIVPKIRKALTSQNAVWDFVCELVELPMADVEWTDSGVIFHRPVPASADGEHIAAEALEPEALVQ